MKTKLRLAGILIFFVSINLFAQKNENQENRAAQVTLFYPVGSNGTYSGNITNRLSFNILVGYSGGLDGVELGGFLNINRDFVQGVQFSGFGNVTGGPVHGVQFAGFANFNNGITNGFQGAGFANFTSGYSEAFQGAGFGNFSHDLRGAQLAGFGNFASGKVEGAQFAGFGNFATDVNGAQIAGFINVAKHVNGVQLGVLNVADSVSNGIPIGIFSIVKNGYYELEFTGGEVLYSNLNYKMGVEKFYTIYKLGYSTYKSNPVYSFGLGFGSNVWISGKHKFSLELSANQIVYNKNWDWDNDLNLLNKVDVNYKYSITEKFSFLVGPSFNVYVTKEEVNGEFGTLNIPYSFYEDEWSGGKVQIWLGLNAGLSLTL